jgi:hypothetical protein
VSLLAEAFVVARGDVGGLVKAATPKRRLFGKGQDTFEEQSSAVTREAVTPTYPGVYLTAALPYLEERGVPPLDDELGDEAAALSTARRTTFLLFAPSAKEHLAALDAAARDEAEMQRYVEDFFADDDPAGGRGLRDALAFLREQIAALDDDSVLLLRIG